MKSVAPQPQRSKTDWSGCCQMTVRWALWLAKRLSLNLNFSFLNQISLLLISSSYPIVLYVCTFEVLGCINISGHWRTEWMISDDNDGQMMFGDLGGLKLPDICLTGEEKPRKNLTQETCPDRGSNPGPLHDRRTCYRQIHSRPNCPHEAGWTPFQTLYFQKNF